VIGFNPDQYTVDESDGSVNFTVAVLSGELELAVVVEFFTEDGSAEGRTLCFTYSRFMSPSVIG
jgi:hypothetical protein